MFKNEIIQYDVSLGGSPIIKVTLQCNMLSKIYGLHGVVNHQIIQYSEMEKLITDRQTDRQHFLL